MMLSIRFFLRPVAFIFLFISVSSVLAKTTVLDSSNTMALTLRKAIIDAKPSDKIILPKGTFVFNKPISLFTKNVSLEGQGAGETILDFAEAAEGAQAILVRAHGVKIRNLTIKNSPGDGIVARGVRNAGFSHIQVYWDKGFDPGGYGIYPVQCEDVVVEGSVVSGAKEAGVYVGQTKRAVIKDNKVFSNVVGIDIENSSYVQVFGNEATGNSVGVTVVGRPYLIVGNPKNIDIYNNFIDSNNHKNFAEKGSLAELMGSGYGIKVISTKDVSVQNNRLSNHSQSSVYVANFQVLNRVHRGDPMFDPMVTEVKVGGDQFKKHSITMQYLKVGAPEESKSEDSKVEKGERMEPSDIQLHGVLGKKNQQPSNVICIQHKGEASKKSVKLNGFSNLYKASQFNCKAKSSHI